jgi:hypothetical protein
MKQKSPKTCQNPYCKAQFVPTRKNNAYCSKKCYSNFSNSLTDEERKKRSIEKAVKKNDLILLQIFHECHLIGADLNKISKRIFESRKFKFDVFSKIEEVENGQPIYWIHYYAIQPNVGNETFKILQISRKDQKTIPFPSRN